MSDKYIFGLERTVCNSLIVTGGEREVTMRGYGEGELTSTG